jgi:two-component system sensor histidine kinase VicK
MSAEPPHSLPEDIFRTVFEKSPGSLLIKADAPRFTILAASDSYLAVTTTTRDAILGRGFSEVFPENEAIDDAVKAQHIFKKVVETGEKIDIPGYRYDIFDPDTYTYEEHHWSCSNVPVFGDDGKIAYILNTVVDITAEVKAREDAIEIANRLRMANEATGLATWDLNLIDQSFIYSPRMAEIFGHNTNETLSLAAFRSQLSDEDTDNIVKPSFRQALLTGEYLYEVKITCPDASIRWIKTQGVIIFDPNKKPVRMLGTILDITESKRDEIRKNDFIAMASHELKTPLTSLKAYIQLLAKKITNTDDAFINTALIKANNQVNKMSDLVYGFLDLSRLESGKLQVKMQAFDINKLLEETIAETVLLSYSHQIIFKPGKATSVYADRDRIAQVISNFLSNAIKYSPKESTVTVSTGISDGNVRVSVSDTGIGIRPKDQEKLFQRFYRVENENIKNISGFGIGLYLASEIIQRHNGKIWVESKEDEGSTFSFSLPVS